MRNYVKVLFSTVWTDPAHSLFLDMNFAGDKKEDEAVRGGWIESFQPTFPDVVTAGPVDCWVEVDNKATYLGVLNAARGSLDFPQSGNVPKWIKFDESPRNSGLNSKTEKPHKPILSDLGFLGAQAVVTSLGTDVLEAYAALVKKLIAAGDLRAAGIVQFAITQILSGKMSVVASFDYLTKAGILR